MSEEKSESVELVKQEHGGALRPGGKPGNAGGGRPSSAIRAEAREIFDRAMGTIRKIVAGEPIGVTAVTFKCAKCEHKNRETVPRYPSDASMIKAIELVGKYGIRSEGYDRQLIVGRLAPVVKFHVEKLIAGEETLEAIEEAWSRILSEYE